MTRDAVIFGIAGACFGIVLGWILGSQQATKPAAPPTTTAAPAQAQAGNERPFPELDVQRAATLEREAKARPNDAPVRVELANLYFDAGRLRSGRILRVSTDLALCYLSLRQPDKALAQIDKSLAIDPKHLKTLLNQGIIRAFGKEDLAGAQESWEKVVKFGPNTPEAARAQQGLDGLRSAHSTTSTPTPAPTPAGRNGGRGGGEE